LVTAGLVVGGGVAAAQPGGPPIRVAHSQQTILLDGLTADYPLADQTFDTVALSGQLHIVSNIKLNENGAATSLILNMNLQGADAVGDFAYAIGGSGEVFGPSPPPIYPTDPVHLGGSYIALFTILPTVPPNPILPPNPIQPLRVGLNLTFDSAGTLTAAEIEQVVIGAPIIGD
jgi:hypothetical protein